MSTTVTLVIGIPLFLVGVYLSIRFGSAAYYKSKREFFEWYKQEKLDFNRRKED